MALPSIGGESPEEHYPGSPAHSRFYNMSIGAGKAHWASIWLPWILFTLGWIILLCECLLVDGGLVAGQERLVNCLLLLPYQPFPIVFMQLG